MLSQKFNPTLGLYNSDPAFFRVYLTKLKMTDASLQASGELNHQHTTDLSQTGGCSIRYNGSHARGKSRFLIS